MYRKRQTERMSKVNGLKRTVKCYLKEIQFLKLEVSLIYMFSKSKLPKEKYSYIKPTNISNLGYIQYTTSELNLNKVVLKKTFWNKLNPVCYRVRIRKSLKMCILGD